MNIISIGLSVVRKWRFTQLTCKGNWDAEDSSLDNRGLARGGELRGGELRGGCDLPNLFFQPTVYLSFSLGVHNSVATTLHELLSGSRSIRSVAVNSAAVGKHQLVLYWLANMHTRYSSTDYRQKIAFMKLWWSPQNTQLDPNGYPIRFKRPQKTF